MAKKIMTDEELKMFLKKLKVDVLKIDHAYRPSETCLSCISCDYVTNRCFLCEQCITCCKLNVKNIAD